MVVGGLWGGGLVVGGGGLVVGVGGWGVGDWGLGIGDWGWYPRLSKSRFPNPQSRPSRHLAARPERMRQRPAVHVLEFAAQRHAVGEAAGAHTMVAGELGEAVRGGFAFHGGVGGDDQILRSDGHTSELTS